MLKKYFVLLDIYFLVFEYEMFLLVTADWMCKWWSVEQLRWKLQQKRETNDKCPEMKFELQSELKQTIFHDETNSKGVI